jgi:cellobiose-specific phosphotransferase system component IIA
MICQAKKNIYQAFKMKKSRQAFKKICQAKKNIYQAFKMKKSRQAFKKICQAKKNICQAFKIYSNTIHTKAFSHSSERGPFYGILFSAI